MSPCLAHIHTADSHSGTLFSPASYFSPGRHKGLCVPKPTGREGFILQSHDDLFCGVFLAQTMFNSWLPRFSFCIIRQWVWGWTPSPPLLCLFCVSILPVQTLSRLWNYCWPLHTRPPTVGPLPLIPFETYPESNNQLDSLKNIFKINHNKASFIVSSLWATRPNRNEHVTI